MNSNKVRLDRWLWAARFYKTRALAVSAIKRGRVSVNQHSAKPAKLICIGDALNIRKAQLIFQIKVTALSEKRLGASLAQALYTEPQSSVNRRVDRQQALKLSRQSLINGRPNKKQRRLQQAMKRKITSNQYEP